MTLADCDRCLTGSDDECLEVVDCAEVCRSDERELAFACVTGLGSCVPDAIQACLDLDAGGSLDLADTCGLGCQALHGCGRCTAVGGGDCLSLEGCAALCREQEAEDNARCVLAVAGCDTEALDACFAEAPADDCELGCTVIGGCALCIRDDSGACLGAEGCAENCRSAGLSSRYACVGQVTDCDSNAMNACFADSVSDADPCELGCGVIYGCGWCTTDDDDICMTQLACVDECRAELDYYAYACVADYGECDEGAFSLCLLREPPALPSGPCGDCMGSACGAEVALCEADESCDALARASSRHSRGAERGRA